MALGGGSFTTQNKVLPGAYINFVSVSRANAALSDRGYMAVPLLLDWGVDGEVFTVGAEEFQKESLSCFGYGYTDEALKPVRELFKCGRTLYAYRLNSGEKAECAIAGARYTGTRGNDLRITVSVNGENTSAYDVLTYLDTTLVDSQTAEDTGGLQDNDFVIWKKNAALSEHTGENIFSGGSNKTEVESQDYQSFLDKIEPYSFNVLGCPSSADGIKGLFVDFTKRMRDQNGIKFQTVVYRKNADYEGIISVENKVKDGGLDDASLVYWVCGAQAGCEVNKSNTNKAYDGEYEIDCDYRQRDLEEKLGAGSFLFHKVGDTVRVLDDINTFISAADDKNSDFNSNQVIRVLDQIANDIAVLFNTRYLGKVQNNAAGRIAFWNDIVTYNKELQALQAIEDFTAEDVEVTEGKDKKSVAVTNAVKPVNAMTKLYMTVMVA